MEDLDAVVQGKIDGDAEFQASIAELSEEEKDAKLAEKKSEVLKQEFSSLSQKAKEAEEATKKFEDQRKRAELAEAELKKLKPGDAALSETDIFALMKSGIELDDVEEVKRLAKAYDLPVAQALNNKTIKSVLAERAEERKSAQAAATKEPRGITNVSPESILEKAEATGEVPDTDEGMKKLFTALTNRKLKVRR